MARASSGHPQRPIAVAVVRAWNLNPGSVPRKHGAQVAYDYFRIVDLRDVPLPQRAALGVPPFGARTSSSRRWSSGLLLLPPPSPRGSRSSSTSGGTTAGGGLCPGSTTPRSESRGGLRLVDSADELQVLRLQARLHGSAGLGPAAATGGDSPRPSWNRVLAVGHGPPQAAATLYAIVGVTPQGQVQPLYGREVVYDIGRSYRQVGVPYQEGGLHGFESVRAAARNEPPAALEGCALPLAVAKLRAWKLGRPAQTATQAPDKRIGLDFVRVERLLQAPQELAVTSQSIRLWREPCSGPVSPPARNHHVTVQSLSR
ncbi:hypothetical protein PLESTM_000339400 [Pleodorina starrii]|nr:hypothetical protein PLESTM_000339400 [Pleodorina starrii]